MFKQKDSFARTLRERRSETLQFLARLYDAQKSGVKVLFAGTPAEQSLESYIEQIRDSLQDLKEWEQELDGGKLPSQRLGLSTKTPSYYSSKYGDSERDLI